MDHPTIFIIDADPKNLQILKDGLVSSGFSVITAADGREAWEIIHSQHPDIILSEVNLPILDGFQLLEKLKADPTTSHIPMMFLTNRREIQDRVRSLRGGVKDYMIKPLHVKEVIARVRMILRRLERVRNDDAESTKKLVGRLEEYSVVELIESFGVERKSGILNVYNENNRNGEIYFRGGAVVHAQLGALKAEKAVYQMLPWRRGHFSMVFREVNVEDTISVSNLGLLLHGYKRMEEREKYFKSLPTPETTFVLSKSFRNILAKKELPPDVAKFIALIDGQRDIMQIIDDSTYDDLQTLEKLSKLYQQGFIKPGKAADHKPAEIKVADIPAAEARPAVPRGDSVAKKPAPEKSARRPQETPPPAAQPVNAPNAAPADAREAEVQAHQNGDMAARAAGVNVPAERPEAETEPSGVFDESREEAANAEPKPAAETARAQEPAAISRRGDEVAPAQENGRNGDGIGLISLERGAFPEPLGVSDFRPDLDILEALAKFRLPEEKPVQGDEIAVESPLSASAELGEDELGAAEHLALDRIEENLDDPESGIDAVESIDFRDELAPEGEDFEFHLRRYGPTKKESAARAPAKAKMKPAESEQGQSIDGDKEAAEGDRTTAEVPKAAPAGRKHVAKLPSRDLPKIEQEAAQFTDLAHLSPRAPRTAPISAARAARGSPKEGDLAVAVEQLLERVCATAGALPAKFVIIGREGSQIGTFADFLLDGGQLKEFQNKSFAYLGVSQRSAGKQAEIGIVGISMEGQFTNLLDSLAEGFAGYVILLDSKSLESIEYISYLHQSLKKKYNKPFGLAVIDAGSQPGFAVETIRDLIHADQEDIIHKLRLDDNSSKLQFLQTVFSDESLQRWKTS